jgi:hypothetical protein
LISRLSKKFDFFSSRLKLTPFCSSVNDDADEADEALGILTLMKSTTSPVHQKTNKPKVLTASLGSRRRA